MNSPIIRKWLPGMIASTTSYTLRSNIPELVAKQAFVATPGVIKYDPEKKLSYCSTITKEDTTTLSTKDLYVAGIIVRVETLVYDQNQIFDDKPPGDKKIYYPGVPYDGAIMHPNDKELTLLTTGDIVVETEVETKPGDNVYFRLGQTFAPRADDDSDFIPTNPPKKIYTYTNIPDEIKFTGGTKAPDHGASGTIRIPNAYFVEHISPTHAVLHFVAPNIIEKNTP